MVAVKFVQVHDDDRRRQMVRELKAFYSMSVAPLDDDDEPECDPSASSVSILSQASETSVANGRLSDGTNRNRLLLDEVSNTPEIIATRNSLERQQSTNQQDPAKRKRVKRRSPFIVNFYDAYTDPERGAVAIVLEYMNAGSLQDLIHNNIRPDEKMIATIAYSVLQGLHAIHSRQIIHRDVKPGNILLTRDGHVKLSDFGVMRELVDTINARTFTGTMYYMSPERIRGEKYSFQSDIWSLGVSLITLATGKIPFPTDSGYWGLVGAIQDGPAPSLPEGGEFSKDLCDFVNECVKLDQHERPTANILLDHPFLSKWLVVDPAQYPPRFSLPKTFPPANERTMQYITDSVLEWQMEHLFDEEYYPSPSEPGRRHSISHAGDRKHNVPEMLLQKLTLIRYNPRQITRLANQIAVNAEALQLCFNSRWELAEEQLRNNGYYGHVFHSPAPFHSSRRQKSWRDDERHHFSDSVGSTYATPRANHGNNNHGPPTSELTATRRKSATGRRPSLTVTAVPASQPARVVELDAHEAAPRQYATFSPADTTSSGQATPPVDCIINDTAEVSPRGHLPTEDRSPAPKPALTSPESRKLYYLHTHPAALVSPISTKHEKGHSKSPSIVQTPLERRRASSRSLTDLEEADFHGEAATPRTIEKPMSPLLLTHNRTQSTDTDLDAQFSSPAISPTHESEPKGARLALIPAAVMLSVDPDNPNCKFLDMPVEIHGHRYITSASESVYDELVVHRIDHDKERKVTHQRLRSRNYASHVRNHSSSTNSSTTESYRPTRGKSRIRRRSLPDEAYASAVMPSMGSMTSMQDIIRGQIHTRRHTLCAIAAPPGSSTLSVYGPVSDDEIPLDCMPWSTPTSAARRPSSALSPFDDQTDLSKDSLTAFEIEELS